MTTRASSFGGGRLLLGAGAAALLLLGGCVMAPVDPYYDVGTPVTTYPYGPSYVAPAYPAYPSYSAPYYYGPSMSLGIYGGWSDNDRRGWRDRPRRPNWGDRDGPRPGWNGHNGQRPGWSGQPGPRPEPRATSRNGSGWWAQLVRHRLAPPAMLLSLSICASGNSATKRLGMLDVHWP